MELNRSELSGKIIEAAIRVHRELGPGFLESIYEAALCCELDVAGLRYVRQFPVQISYRGKPVGEHRLDLLIEDVVVVELKAVTEFDPIHFAVTRSYLKATGRELALLINFAATAVAIKRVGREWHSRSR